MKSLILIFIFFVGLGCSDDDPNNLSESDLEFVHQGAFNLENEQLAKTYWVIRSESELESVFPNEPQFLSFFEDKAFNFSTHLMLVATDEVRYTGGYSVNIEFGNETTTNVYFDVIYNEPEGDRVTLPVHIPFQVKKYPITLKDISFRN